MRDDEKTFELACKFIRESPAAVLIADPETGEELWIPLSQVEEMHRDKNNLGTIVMTKWIARKKGLC